MPTPRATAIIQKALSDCLGKNASMVHDFLEDAIAQLQDDSFEDFHEVCEPLDGFNLGSMACRIRDGWSGHHLSMFRQLVLKGYNPNMPDKAGRVPSVRALENDRIWMNVEDLKWAFSHQLDPLAFYPDSSNGRSLLSIDFAEGRDGEMLDYFATVLQERLSLLDASARNTTLAMLQETSLPCYASMLADIECGLLNQVAPTRELVKTRRSL